MKTFLVLLSIFFSALQALITYYWQNESTNVTSSSASMLKYLYGQVPAWTEFAFSIGIWWYVIAAVFAIGSITAYFLVSSKLAHACITLLSAVVAISMIYAMYPIHLMASGSFI